MPAAHLVGAENSGFAQIVKQFQNERIGLAVKAYVTAGRADHRTGTGPLLCVRLVVVADVELLGR